MIRRDLSIIAALAMAGLGILHGGPAEAAATRSSGWLEFEAGHLDHPLGVAGEDASPYAQGTLVYELGVPTDTGRFEFSYRGDLTGFAAGVDLGYARHAVGVEYVRPAGDRSRLSLSAGVQGALRRQEQAYQAYDHEEAVGYLAAKTYPHPRLMLSAVAGLRLRRYANLPEESYVEPHLTVEAKHFSPSRLTLGASLRLGGKWYHDPAAVRVWDSTGTPATSQLAASVVAAQGVSDRLGLRASLERRATLDGFPYYVGEQVFDNPLLDRYARSGWAADGSVKWLTPQTVWVRLGLGWRRDDYGEIRFATAAEGGAQRLDRVVSVWMSLERRLALGDVDLTLSAHATYTDQSSTLTSYTWTGPTAGAGLLWRW